MNNHTFTRILSSYLQRSSNDGTYRSEHHNKKKLKKNKLQRKRKKFFSANKRLILPKPSSSKIEIEATTMKEDNHTAVEKHGSQEFEKEDLNQLNVGVASSDQGFPISNSNNAEQQLAHSINTNTDLEAHGTLKKQDSEVEEQQINEIIRPPIANQSIEPKIKSKEIVNKPIDSVIPNVINTGFFNDDSLNFLQDHDLSNVNCDPFFTDAWYCTESRNVGTNPNNLVSIPVEPEEKQKLTRLDHLEKELEKLKTQQADMKRQNEDSVKSNNNKQRDETTSVKKSTETQKPSQKKHRISSGFDYFDSGDHLCAVCCKASDTLIEHMYHLHAIDHTRLMDTNHKPWLKRIRDQPTKFDLKKALPLQGMEFVLPVSGYYCELCHCTKPDASAAVMHCRSQEHNQKYVAFCKKNSVYESSRKNLIRQLEGFRKIAKSLGLPLPLQSLVAKESSADLFSQTKASLPPLPRNLDLVSDTSQLNNINDAKRKRQASVATNIDTELGTEKRFKKYENSVTATCQTKAKPVQVQSKFPPSSNEESRSCYETAAPICQAKAKSAAVALDSVIPGCQHHATPAGTHSIKRANSQKRKTWNSTEQVVNDNHVSTEPRLSITVHNLNKEKPLRIAELQKSDAIDTSKKIFEKQKIAKHSLIGKQICPNFVADNLLDKSAISVSVKDKNTFGESSKSLLGTTVSSTSVSKTTSSVTTSSGSKCLDTAVQRKEKKDQARRLSSECTPRGICRSSESKNPVLKRCNILPKIKTFDLFQCDENKKNFAPLKSLAKKRVSAPRMLNGNIPPNRQLRTENDLSLSSGALSKEISSCKPKEGNSLEKTPKQQELVGKQCKMNKNLSHAACLRVSNANLLDKAVTSFPEPSSMKASKPVAEQNQKALNVRKSSIDSGHSRSLKSSKSKNPAPVSCGDIFKLENQKKPCLVRSPLDQLVSADYIFTKRPLVKRRASAENKSVKTPQKVRPASPEKGKYHVVSLDFLNSTSSTIAKTLTSKKTKLIESPVQRLSSTPLKQEKSDNSVDSSRLMVCDVINECGSRKKFLPERVGSCIKIAFGYDEKENATRKLKPSKRTSLAGTTCGPKEISSTSLNVSEVSSPKTNSKINAEDNIFEKFTIAKTKNTARKSCPTPKAIKEKSLKLLDSRFKSSKSKVVCYKSVKSERVSSPLPNNSKTKPSSVFIKKEPLEIPRNRTASSACDSQSQFQSKSVEVHDMKPFIQASVACAPPSGLNSSANHIHFAFNSCIVPTQSTLSKMTASNSLLPAKRLVEKPTLSQALDSQRRRARKSIRSKYEQ